MLKYIVIFATTRCDLQCVHCVQGRPSRLDDFPVELLPGLLKEARQFGTNHVTLTGGEAHFHPQFEALVQEIVEAGYSWSIVTNGQQTLPYINVIEKYSDRLTSIFLSLDGASPHTHDSIRGKAGAYLRMLEAIRCYLEKGIQVRTITCLNPLNKHELDEIVRVGLELGVSGMRFAGVIPAPWNQHLWLSDAEKLELYQHIRQSNKETSIPLFATSALHTPGGINFCDVLNLRSLHFNSRGEMVFCCDAQGHRTIIGQLGKQPLNKLIEKWLNLINEMLLYRTQCIARGQMGEGFDTCAFCNAYSASGDQTNSKEFGEITYTHLETPKSY